ncbi:unnamed protein product [Symbiodinium necroappetens]|uniref:Phosphatidate phosphatase APP1 catalytic domain-containing protein n=1 Tax=Symbiodinium necroappetens TaxID=1628268 RepID=A0A812W471_9DINO|nr:unnamed protein product [Symbiodinium necroappetens]
MLPNPQCPSVPPSAKFSQHVLIQGRQLLYRTLDGASESDFDDGATERYEERARLIFRSLQLPLLHDRTLQLLEVRIGGPRVDDSGWQRLPPTDAHGVVEANVRFSDDDIQLIDRLQGNVAVEVRLAETGDTVDSTAAPQRRPSAAPVQAVAELLSPDGFGVISDIDDTVKVTEVFYGIKAVLQNTFLKTFDAVPGMAALYQGWAKQRASFHYVSKSPPELHGPLSDFLQKKGFPVSSVHLCPLLGRDRANFKLRQVTSLLSQFPNRKFILVGDSGERDAEVYAEIMRKHPSQVLKVLIRAVMAEDVENIEKARAAFKGIDEAKWQVFTDPADIVEPESRSKKLYEEAQVYLHKAVTGYFSPLTLHEEEVWHDYGLVLWHVGRHMEAAHNFQNAVITNPSFPKGYNNLACALVLLGLSNQPMNVQLVQQGLQAAEQAISLAPHTPLYWRNAAVLLSMTGDQQSAIAAWERFRQADPRTAAAEEALGGIPRDCTWEFYFR